MSNKPSLNEEQPYIDHGFLGVTSQGVISINANWPIYPAEHGWEIALLAFGQFPKDTIFKQIDDIDRCFLFFVNSSNYGHVKDFTDKKYFHIAAWYEDLIDLSEMGYVTGVKRLDEYEWRCKKYQQIPKGAYAVLNGKKVYVQPPQEPPGYGTEEAIDEYPKNFACIENGWLEVTSNGYKALDNLINDLSKNLDDELVSVVQPLITLGRYDTAVREGCLMLESLLRKKAGLGNELYGTKLIDEFYEKILGSKKYIVAYVKILRGDLRAIFKFVRNEYMHNFVALDIEQCYAILWKISLQLGRLRSVEGLELSPKDVIQK